MVHSLRGAVLDLDAQVPRLCILHPALPARSQSSVRDSSMPKQVGKKIFPQLLDNWGKYFPQLFSICPSWRCLRALAPCRLYLTALVRGLLLRGSISELCRRLVPCTSHLWLRTQNVERLRLQGLPSRPLQACLSQGSITWTLQCSSFLSLIWFFA